MGKTTTLLKKDYFTSTTKATTLNKERLVETLEISETSKN